MYLLRRNYKTHLQHNYLLFLSLLLVALATFSVMKSSNYITITPMPSHPKIVQEKILKIVITPVPVVKKQVVKPKPIKKVIKKKVIKKEIVKKVEPVKTVALEPVVQKVQEPIVEEVVVAKVTPVVPKPVFDAQMKASFIAGLYAMLEEQKYYPKMAKRRKLEGVVEISFTLSKDGKIKDVFVYKDCNHSMLNKAALKVVKSIVAYKPIPDAVSMASLNLNIPIKYSRR